MFDKWNTFATFIIPTRFTDKTVFVSLPGIGRDHAEREELARYTHRPFGHCGRLGSDRVLYRPAVTSVPRTEKSRQ